MRELVTLFGGAGFLGRYVARELARAGVRVRLCGRRPAKAWSVKPQGALGQFQFVAVDASDRVGVERAIAGADTVINLVGVLAGDFQRSHVTAARTIADVAAAAGVTSLVHVSAIGADPASPSAYGRSKGDGEAAVRAAFPQAAIVRPSILFGPEDDFVNKFAIMARLLPILPVIRGDARFQPAFVADAAKAIAMAALDPATYGGRTFELGGPQVVTMRALNQWVAGAIGRRPAILDIPDALAELMAAAGSFVPGVPITRDQLKMLGVDNVVAAGAEDFAAFGIAPRPLAAVAPEWLVRYRRHGRFAPVTVSPL